MIMTGERNELVSLDQVETIKIVPYEKDFAISAFPKDDGKKPRTLGRYYHRSVAEDEMMRLYMAVEGGAKGYMMAETHFDQEEILVHDARVRRKGGS